MKIIVTFFAALFLFGSLNGYAQPIPNGGFESFTDGEPDRWVTSNIPFLGARPVVQSSDAHSGASAVRGDVVIAVSGDTIPPLLLVGSGSAFGFTSGYAYTGAPTALEFYYKFTSVNGDQLSALAVLSNKGESFGSGFIALNAAAGYTKVVMPINRDMFQTPDTAQVAFSISSADGESSPSPGSFFILDDVRFIEVTGGVENQPAEGVTLLQNYPNPCNPSTSIPFALNERSTVSITLYNTSGEAVRTLLNSVMNPGEHMIKADLNGLASGVYTYELKSGANTLRKRLILAK